MKIYKFKFTKLHKILIYLGLVLCAVIFSINLYNCITQGVSTSAIPSYTIIQYTVSFIFSVLLFIVLLSLLLSSYYAIVGRELKTSFGIIKSTFKIDDIENVTLDRKTNKLTLNFSNGEFMIVAVSEDWYNELVENIIDINKKIEYTIVSDDDAKKA